MFPNLSVATIGKIVCGLVGLVLLVTLWLVVRDRDHWKSKAEAYNAEAATVYQATITASGNPKLERKDTAQQILQLGSSLAAVTAALNQQNASVDALAKQSSIQQQKAAQASQEAAAAAKDAAAARDRLRQAARSAAIDRAPGDHCEPLDTVKGQWE